MGEGTVVLHNRGSRSGARVFDKLRKIAPQLDGGDRIAWVPFAELKSVKAIPKRLIAVGGDGTVNYAATWLRSLGARSELAIVPAGTGNNLARGLGVPLNPEVAFRQALESTTTRPIDAVVVRAGDDPTEHLMLQSGALGFPAQVAQRYDSLRKNALLRLLFIPAGPYIYRVLSALGLVGHAWRRRSSKTSGIDMTQIHVDGERYAEPSFALFLGNERSLGGNFIPCPRALLDDGLTDICIVRELPVSRYPSLFKRVARGTHDALEKEVFYAQGKSIAIELPEASPLLLDGDLPVSASRYQLRTLAGAVQLVTGATKP